MQKVEEIDEIFIKGSLLVLKRGEKADLIGIGSYEELESLIEFIKAFDLKDKVRYYM